MGDECGDTKFSRQNALFYWVSTFADPNVVNRDTLEGFLKSTTLQRAIDHVGVPTLALESGSVSLPVITSKLSNDLRERIKTWIGILHGIRTHYESHLKFLLVTVPPNAFHIVTCDHCGVIELEKVLRLVFGLGIEGRREQEIIRRIREFSPVIQQQLISVIKEITSDDNHDVLRIKSRTDFDCCLETEKGKMYEYLIDVCRQLITERNDLIQWRRLVEFVLGQSPCERSDSSLLNMDQILRSPGENSATRELRKELSESSTLLRECSSELNLSKTDVANYKAQIIDMQCQIELLRRNRDENDVLRESQRKLLIAEAELVKLRERLNDAEEYEVLWEVLRKTNKALQLNIVKLEDLTNVLEVDKQMLEGTVNELGTKVAQQSEIIQKLHDSIDTNRKELNQLHAKMECQRSQFLAKEAVFLTQLEQLRLDNSTYRETLETKEKTIEEMQRQQAESIAAKNQEIDEVRAELEGQRSLLLANEVQFQIQLEQVQRDKANIQRSLEMKVTTIDEMVRLLQESLETKDKDLEQLRIDAEGQRSQFLAKEGEFLADLEQLRLVNSTCRETLELKEKTIEEMQQHQAESIAAKNQELDEVRTELEGQRSLLLANEVQFQIQLEQVQRDKTNIQRSLEMKVTTIDEMVRLLQESLETKDKELEQQRIDAVGQRSQFLSKEGELLAELEQLRLDNSTFRKTVETKEKTIEEMGHFLQESIDCKDKELEEQRINAEGQRSQFLTKEGEFLADLEQLRLVNSTCWETLELKEKTIEEMQQHQAASIAAKNQEIDGVRAELEGQRSLLLANEVQFQIQLEQVQRDKANIQRSLEMKVTTIDEMVRLLQESLETKDKELEQQRINAEGQNSQFLSKEAEFLAELEQLRLGNSTLRETLETKEKTVEEMERFLQESIDCKDKELEQQRINAEGQRSQFLAKEGQLLAELEQLRLDNSTFRETVETKEKTIEEMERLLQESIDCKDKELEQQRINAEGQRSHFLTKEREFLAELEQLRLGNSTLRETLETKEKTIEEMEQFLQESIETKEKELEQQRINAEGQRSQFLIKERELVAELELLRLDNSTFLETLEIKEKTFGEIELFLQESIDAKEMELEQQRINAEGQRSQFSNKEGEFLAELGQLQLENSRFRETVETKEKRIEEMQDLLLECIDAKDKELEQQRINAEGERLRFLAKEAEFLAELEQLEFENTTSQETRDKTIQEMQQYHIESIIAKNQELERVRNELEGQRSLLLATENEFQKQLDQLHLDNANFQRTFETQVKATDEMEATHRASIVAKDLELGQLRSQLEGQRSTFEGKQDQFLEIIQKIQRDLADCQGSIQGKDQVIEQLRTQIEAQILHGTDFERQRSDLKRKVEDQAISLLGLESQVKTVRAENVALNARAEKIELETKLRLQDIYRAKFETMKVKMTEVCKQELDGSKEEVETMKREKALLRANNIELGNQNYALEQKCRDLEAKLTLIEEHLKILKRTPSYSTLPTFPTNYTDDQDSRRLSVTSIQSNGSGRIKVVPNGSGSVFQCDDEDDFPYNGLSQFEAQMASHGTGGGVSKDQSGFSTNEDRISELQRRNSMVPRHLKSVYSVEYATLGNDVRLDEEQMRVPPVKFSKSVSAPSVGMTSRPPKAKPHVIPVTKEQLPGPTPKKPQAPTRPPFSPTAHNVENGPKFPKTKSESVLSSTPKKKKFQAFVGGKFF